MATIDMDTFVKVLKSKVANGLTYEKLESMTGIPKSSIQRYVQKGNGPATRIDSIVNALGISEEIYRSNHDYQTGPFGERLIRIMTERFIDEEDLAAMTNMEVDEVQGLMADPEPPTDDILCKLALVLAVDVPWLRGDTSKPLLYLGNDEYQVIYGYRQASDDTRRAIRAILTAK